MTAADLLTNESYATANVSLLAHLHKLSTAHLNVFKNNKIRHKIGMKAESNESDKKKQQKTKELSVPCF